MRFTCSHTNYLGWSKWPFCWQFGVFSRYFWWKTLRKNWVTDKCRYRQERRKVGFLSGLFFTREFSNRYPFRLHYSGAVTRSATRNCPTGCISRGTFSQFNWQLCIHLRSIGTYAAINCTKLHAKRHGNFVCGGEFIQLDASLY